MTFNTLETAVVLVSKRRGAGGSTYYSGSHMAHGNGHPISWGFFITFLGAVLALIGVAFFKFRSRFVNMSNRDYAESQGYNPDFLRQQAYDQNDANDSFDDDTGTNYSNNNW